MCHISFEQKKVLGAADNNVVAACTYQLHRG